MPSDRRYLVLGEGLVVDVLEVLRDLTPVGEHEHGLEVLLFVGLLADVVDLEGLGEPGDGVHRGSDFLVEQREQRVVVEQALLDLAALEKTV